MLMNSKPFTNPEGRVPVKEALSHAVSLKNVSTCRCSRSCRASPVDRSVADGGSPRATRKLVRLKSTNTGYHDKYPSLLDFKIEIYFCKIFQMIVYFFQTFDSIGNISKVTVKNGDIYISHHWKVKVTGTSRLQTNTCLQIESVLVLCCYMVNLVPEILIYVFYVFCYYQYQLFLSLSFSLNPSPHLEIKAFTHFKE